MKYYIDITLLPTHDISIYFLWEKLYQQVHLILVESKDPEGNIKIGAAFPEYNRELRHLGNKLRLFSQSNLDLQQLNLEKWLCKLKDYLHFTTVRNIPNRNLSYAIFKRVQIKNNPQRLARRKAKYLNISYEEAFLSFDKYKKVYSTLPHIRIKSLSSERRYVLLIDKVETDYIDIPAHFTSYGLSSKYALPIF
jgi:CRISPR-associated endonuclease Csy4